MSRGAKEAEQRENRQALRGVENTCKSGDQGSWGSWWAQFARLVGPQDCNKCPLRRLHDWSSFRVRAVLRAPICCAGNRGVAHARQAVSEPKGKGRIDFPGGLCAQDCPLKCRWFRKPIRCIALLLHSQLTGRTPASKTIPVHPPKTFACEKKLSGTTTLAGSAAPYLPWHRLP